VNQLGLIGGSDSRECGATTSKAINEFSPKVGARVAWLVPGHEGDRTSLWVAVVSIAPRSAFRPERFGGRSTATVSCAMAFEAANTSLA
jgi:hypothetical protein